MIVLVPTIVGCAGVAPGPVALVMPANGRSLAVFQADDDQCRAYALNRLGGVTPELSAATKLVTSVLGASGLLGLIGAAVDGARGARIGATVGAVGAVAGVGLSGYGSESATQSRLDNAYVQCMFTKGHRVPAAASVQSGANESSRSRLKVGVTDPW